jgi:hypothetical protein
VPTTIFFNTFMSIKLTATRTTALVATLCLMASLTMTSCGKKEEPKTENPVTSTAGAVGDAATGAAGTVGGAATGAAGAVGGAATDAAKAVGGAATSAATGAAGAVGGAVASVGAALNPADLKAVTPAKAALTMANSAVAKGDMKAAKTQFDKFSGMWATVEPMVKTAAGDKYAPIESGLEMVKTAMGAAKPDKVEAGKGLKMALDGLNAVMAKK